MRELSTGSEFSCSFAFHLLQLNTKVLFIKFQNWDNSNPLAAETFLAPINLLCYQIRSSLLLFRIVSNAKALLNSFIFHEICMNASRSDSWGFQGGGQIVSNSFSVLFLAWGGRELLTGKSSRKLCAVKGNNFFYTRPDNETTKAEALLESRPIFCTRFSVLFLFALLEASTRLQ